MCNFRKEHSAEKPIPEPQNIFCGGLASVHTFTILQDFHSCSAFFEELVSVELES